MLLFILCWKFDCFLNYFLIGKSVKFFFKFWCIVFFIFILKVDESERNYVLKFGEKFNVFIY